MPPVIEILVTDTTDKYNYLIEWPGFNLYVSVGYKKTCSILTRKNIQNPSS